MTTLPEFYDLIYTEMQTLNTRFQNIHSTLAAMASAMGLSLAVGNKYCVTCDGRGFIFKGSGGGHKKDCPSCGGDGLQRDLPNTL